MIDNFSETKRLNELLEEELQVLKGDYQKHRMSKKQLEQLKQRMEEANTANRRDRNKKSAVTFLTTAAAFVVVLVVLPNTSPVIAHAMEQIPIIGNFVEVVTFSNYDFEEDRNKADIVVPEIKVEESVADSQVQDKLEQSVSEINEEIQRITGELVEEFEAQLEEEEGYQDVIVKSEILTTISDYFTLKPFCYQGAGSGNQWNYYYTIDLSTGERLQLKDIFVEGADYITPISYNIKQQMQEQMLADDKVYYWLNDDIEEWNFKAITEETSFYMNDKGNVVIAFDEGEVAPRYMGAVEFEITTEALQDIRK